RHSLHLHSFPTRRSSDLVASKKQKCSACNYDSEGGAEYREASPFVHAGEVSKAQQEWHINQDRPANGKGDDGPDQTSPRRSRQRSEEHTSELQSRSDLVC